jgi:pyrroline-5-carboxylate reductase
MMKIAVIGAGAMGGATVEGFIKSSAFNNEDITVSDPSQLVIDKFAKQGVLKIMAGNKKDLEDKRQVTKESAELLAQKYGIKCLEVSAKDNINIDELFLEVVKS